MKMRRGQALETLSVLLVFAVFGLSAMMLTLLGAKAYRRIVGGMEESNALRSALSYVANRIHAGDEAGAVTLAAAPDGTDLLCFTETIDGDVYLTCIYYYDRWLREFATVEGNTGFDLADGEKITQMKRFEMEREGRLIFFEAETTGGECRDLQVAIRSAEK